MDPTCPPRLQVVFTQDGQPRQQIFDRVVMTTPCPVIARVCQGLTDEETRRLSQVEYLGVQCTSMLLPKPLGGFYVTNITDDWVPLTGIIEMGSLVPPEKLGGHYLVYLPRYLLADDPRFRESDDAVHDRCMSTLERMYPDFRRQTVAAVQTARAAHVMAIPTLGYSDRLPAVRTSVPGLYVLNSAQIVEGTLNVNETLELLEIEWERSFRQDLESSFVTQG
jgi:protoporphyrinogen oxidase